MSSPARTMSDECFGIDVSNPEYIAYRQGQAELIQPFRLKTNKLIRFIKEHEMSSPEGEFYREGMIKGIREARKVLCGLAGK